MDNIVVWPLSVKNEELLTCSFTSYLKTDMSGQKKKEVKRKEKKTFMIKKMMSVLP